MQFMYTITLVASLVLSASSRPLFRRQDASQLITGKFDNCNVGGAENAIQGEGNILENIKAGTMYYVYAPDNNPANAQILTVKSWKPLQDTVNANNVQIAGDGQSVSVTNINSANQLRSDIGFDAAQLSSLGVTCDGPANEWLVPVFVPASAQ